MKSRLHMAVLLIASRFLAPMYLTSLTAGAQQSALEPAAMGTSSVVPSLINYTGVLKDTSGRTLTSVTGVTFLLYSAEQGGAPLWLETQNVTPDKSGRYTVQLGVTSAKGVPSDLFVSGEARWLAVQIGSEAEQLRALLVAVPYAMKAADAQTLGGLPASAFALATKDRTVKASAASSGPTSPSATSSIPPPIAPNVTTAGGTAQRLAMFTTPTNIQNSIVAQAGTAAIDVLGKLGVNTTAPAQSLDVTSGNAIVRGVGNFKANGETATIYVGDTSHPIRAMYNKGLAIGAFKAPQAIFIADYTGVVGIGTMTPPPNVQLEVDAQRSSYAIRGKGFTAALNSGESGGTGLEGLGGTGDPSNSNSTGGYGILAFGGPGEYADGVGGFFAGANYTFRGDGVDAYAGSGGLAGYFAGDILVTGAVIAGSKDFKIDHPLDPANQYFVHASVESSEMMNMYAGNVTTDVHGEAIVQLPNWFETLNTDFRYQLTVIGQFAQAIVGRKIQNNRFEIRTSAPNVEVSWQVTGVRQDAYAKAHPLVVEQEKEAQLRGYYIHPELYGAPPEKQIEWARHPQMMKQTEELRAKQKKRMIRGAPQRESQSR
jgi:hypothetical protein